MKYFTLEELLFLHFKIIEDYGGSHGVRDEGRLEAVLAATRQNAFGAELYPTVYDKAAVYIRNVMGDHPFVDGNKRTAVTAGIMFMVRNGLTLTATPRELEDYAVTVAVERLGIPEIAEWLRAHSQES